MAGVFIAQSAMSFVVQRKMGSEKRGQIKIQDIQLVEANSSSAEILLLYLRSHDKSIIFWHSQTCHLGWPA
jgi:hypothetical protein